MREFVEVQVTCGSEEEAEGIARALLERRLAACLHLTPVRSLYEWKGEVCDDREVVVVARTRAELIDAVVDLVHEQHSYELPAVTAASMTGSDGYVAWIEERTKS
jgi:periplasmic divalent cation tolerance protein